MVSLTLDDKDTLVFPLIAEEDRQNALAAGMDEHLAKPVELDKLFKTLSKF